ncbi:MAG: calcium-binding protein, partial [Oscillospiraceae bacterium]
GNDTIEDYYCSSSYGKSDKIIFGEGISAENIVFSKSENNLLINFVGTDDSITINNQYYNIYYQIENFSTSDGRIITNTQVNQLIQAMASFEEDTGMDWAEAIEHGNETATDIVSQMWIKSVS